jgi:nitrous oxide reductase accessory protein NosL
MKTIFFLAILGALFGGCKDENENTKFIPPHWDRDKCARCVMVVSDRKNSVEVRDPKTAKTYMFDDIGCMALWFEEENIKWKDDAVVYITDVKTGEWIDAKKAFYDNGNVTPMDFGFSAHKSKDSIPKGKQIFTYDEVIEKITSQRVEQ